MLASVALHDRSGAAKRTGAQAPAPRRATSSRRTTRAGPRPPVPPARARTPTGSSTRWSSQPGSTAHASPSTTPPPGTRPTTSISTTRTSSSSRARTPSAPGTPTRSQTQRPASTQTAPQVLSVAPPASGRHYLAVSRAKSAAPRPAISAPSCSAGRDRLSGYNLILGDVRRTEYACVRTSDVPASALDTSCSGVYSPASQPLVVVSKGGEGIAFTKRPPSAVTARRGSLSRSWRRSD